MSFPENGFPERASETAFAGVWIIQEWSKKREGVKHNMIEKGVIILERESKSSHIIVERESETPKG